MQAPVWVEKPGQLLSSIQPQYQPQLQLELSLAQLSPSLFSRTDGKKAWIFVEKNYGFFQKKMMDFFPTKTMDFFRKKSMDIF